MDAGLFDFKGLRTSGEANDDGDIAFDEEPRATFDNAPKDVIHFLVGAD